LPEQRKRLCGTGGGQKGREKETRNISPNSRGQKKNLQILAHDQAPGGVFSFRFVMISDLEHGRRKRKSLVL